MSLSYLSQYGGVDWVIESYDRFLFGDSVTVDKDGDFEATSGHIHDAISSLPPVTYDGKTVRLGGVYLRTIKDAPKRPLPNAKVHPLKPETTLIPKRDYAVSLYTRVIIDDEPVRFKVELGDIPLIVGTGLFGQRQKQGGYFIVGGMEKVLVLRESRKFDVPLFKCLKKGEYVVEINSYNSPFQISLVNKEIKVCLPFVNKDALPIETMFRAMGYELPIETLFVNTNPDFFDYVEFLHNDQTVQESIFTLGSKFLGDIVSANIQTKKDRIKEVFDERLLPFLKNEEKLPFIVSNVTKLVEMAIASKCPLEFETPLQQESNTNSLLNKQIDTPGYILAKEFTGLLGLLWREFARTLKSSIGKLNEALKTKKRTSDAIIQNLSDPYLIFSQQKKKITNMLNALLRSPKYTMALPRRANWSEAASIVCRVAAAGLDKNSVDMRPRHNQGDQYGFYDVIESQEGEATGRTRDMAIFARVSNKGNAPAWIDALTKLTNTGDCSCYLNLSLRALNVSYDAVYDLKRTMDRYASVVRKDTSVYVTISAGRAVRPVWVVGKQGSDWDDFDTCVAQGRIVFVDSAEVHSLCIATHARAIEPFHTHCELDACALMGLSSSRIPFSEHNYGARNLFGAHVRHQSIGVPFLTIPRHPGVHCNNRFDSDQKHWMFYPQRALCCTKIGMVLGDYQAPCGFNAVVALLCDRNNEEDAITMSQGFVDRGGSRVWSEKTFMDSEGPDVYFGFAPKLVADWNYKNLDSDGIVLPGTRVHKGDVLVAKYHKSSDGTKHDQTFLRWRVRENAVVDAVVKTKNAFEKTAVLIRIRWVRIPRVGDKFALRNGQKGVVAAVVPDTDMPYTIDGMRPDILINPFAFPTRRTGGQLFETLSSKMVCLAPPRKFLQRGSARTVADSTPFSSDFSLDGIKEQLHKSGFDPLGSERMFSGRTGELMKDQVLIGPMYYQMLVHFALEKSYALSTGARHPQTLQPVAGKGDDGGSKQSEMDVKALNAHGAAHFLQQQFLRCSDGIEVYVCNKCQDVTYRSACTKCGSADVSLTNAPRAFIWMKNILKAANIDMKVCVDDR